MSKAIGARSLENGRCLSDVGIKFLGLLLFSPSDFVWLLGIEQIFGAKSVTLCEATERAAKKCSTEITATTIKERDRKRFKQVSKKGNFMEHENKIEQMGENLTTASDEIGEAYREKAGQVWDDAKERVQTVKQDAEQYVRENPTKAIVTALGVGLVLGLIIRR